jgi:hypothetical protein
MFCISLFMYSELLMYLSIFYVWSLPLKSWISFNWYIFVRYVSKAQILESFIINDEKSTTKWSWPLAVKSLMLMTLTSSLIHNHFIDRFPFMVFFFLFQFLPPPILLPRFFQLLTIYLSLNWFSWFRRSKLIQI